MTKLALAVPLKEAADVRRAAVNPALEPRVLLVIDRALRAAWKVLQEDVNERLVLETKGEVNITLRLRAQLNTLRGTGKVAGYNAAAFERPQSGTEYQDYKGANVRKPDLIFALTGNPRPGVFDDLYDAMFVECKLIEQGSGRNVGLYCSKGLIRFVEGSYSWRMPHGMMVAYVRTEQRLPKALADGLDGYGRAKLLGTNGVVHPCSLSKEQPRVYVTEHHRSWTLPEGMPPGPIQVRHLWLPVHR